MKTLRAFLAAIFVLTAAGAVHGAIINKIIATIDGEPVTMYQLKLFTERNIRGRELKSGDRELLLDALITEQIVAKEVAQQGIIVRDDEVQRYIESVRARNKITEEQLEQALAAQGLTMASYRAQIRDDLQRQQLISREIRGKVSVTPEEIQRYYDTHKDEFGKGASGIKVAHIVFRLEPDASPDRIAAVTAKADAAHDRLKSGASFSDLASSISEDPSAKDGGSLGWFKPGEMLDEMDLAVAKMDVGDISDPLRTKMGIHILKLEARRGDASDGPDTQVKEQIKEKLYAQALEERFQKWLTEDLKKRHHIEIR